MAVRIQTDYKELEKWNDRLLRAEGVTIAVANSRKNYVARELLGHIRKNAKGAPGPEVRTGQYRRSWRISRLNEQDSRRLVSFTVVTNHPAAYRLEYGFVGTDSLGRHYNQAPRPHIRPAIAVTKETWKKTLLAAVLAGLTGIPI